MTMLLKKVSPDRKIIDRYMINNVRMCVRKKKLKLDSVNIVINPKLLDTSYITSYQDTADNYSKGKYILK